MLAGATHHGFLPSPHVSISRASLYRESTLPWDLNNRGSEHGSHDVIVTVPHWHRHLAPASGTLHRHWQLAPTLGRGFGTSPGTFHRHLALAPLLAVTGTINNGTLMSSECGRLIACNTTLIAC